MSLLLCAVAGSCTEKRTVIFFMNTNEQTVSRNLKMVWELSYAMFIISWLVTITSTVQPRLSLLSQLLSFMHYIERKPKNKSGGGLGTRLVQPYNYVDISTS